MAIYFDPDMADVDNSAYVSAAVAVSTTQVEAKAGGSTLTKRQALTITNKGPNVIYVGPTGVTSSSGDPLLKDQFISLPTGELNKVYMICATGQSATAIVQEIA